MGFVFSLLFIFVIVPITVAMLFGWFSTKKKIYVKIIVGVWAPLLALILVSVTIKFFTTKKVLKKADYYGNYTINRDYFPGKQADWQYDHFRFEIKRNDSIYFYVTDKHKILKTYRGTVSTSQPYGSARLILKMEDPPHHILSSNPTIFRSAWSFYLVFYSQKFNNVYFKKQTWEYDD